MFDEIPWEARTWSAPPRVLGLWLRAFLAIVAAPLAPVPDSPYFLDICANKGSLPAKDIFLLLMAFSYSRPAPKGCHEHAVSILHPTYFRSFQAESAFENARVTHSAQQTMYISAPLALQSLPT